MSEPDEPGPVERHTWPDRLQARVIAPGTSPVVLGYRLDADLAQHYSFVEIVHLMLRGEAPSVDESRCFSVGLLAAAPLTVAEAPTHASVLARLCGASQSAAIASGVAVLAEQAHDWVLRAQPLIAWLAGERSDYPAEFVGDEVEVRALEPLRALSPDVLQAVFDFSPSRRALALAAFHRSGLRRPGDLIAALIWARVPALAAEALAQRPLDFRSYPMATPDFVYEEHHD